MNLTIAPKFSNQPQQKMNYSANTSFCSNLRLSASEDSKLEEFTLPRFKEIFSSIIPRSMIDEIAERVNKFKEMFLDNNGFNNDIGIVPVKEGLKIQTPYGMDFMETTINTQSTIIPDLFEMELMDFYQGMYQELKANLKAFWL